MPVAVAGSVFDVAALEEQASLLIALFPEIMEQQRIGVRRKSLRQGLEAGEEFAVRCLS
jgi:hypothetical protein